jgi:uncharacterized membrane protein YoaK (UPF0700 family)
VVTSAAVLAGIVGTPGEAARYRLIGLLAIAMGMQNAVVRGLAVPDLTTTVLTMTLSGVAADVRFVGGEGSKIGPRGLEIAMMLVGAVLGASLVLHVGFGHRSLPLRRYWSSSEPLGGLSRRRCARR